MQQRQVPRDARESRGWQLAVPSRHTPIVGRPVNGCVEDIVSPVPPTWTVGCLPPGDFEAVTVRCHRRVEDGSVWLVSEWVEMQRPGEWEDCNDEQIAEGYIENPITQVDAWFAAGAALRLGYRDAVAGVHLEAGRVAASRGGDPGPGVSAGSSSRTRAGACLRRRKGRSRAQPDTPRGRP